MHGMALSSWISKKDFVKILSISLEMTKQYDVTVLIALYSI